jgi:tRNA G18 (ribose-2'-O)-methylase SpoU
VALILGSEAEGPDPVLWAGAERLAIPLLGRAESLNVGMAAAVLLYEVARHREGWKT